MKSFTPPNNRPEPIRLQKYLSECGVASRRNAEEMILSGRVRVNGELPELGAKIDPDIDAVTVDGRPIHEDAKTYIILNKPRGVVTSIGDTHGRRTVIDCLQGLDVRVFPIGRLDMDVEGALLLTNDGELAHRLMHPRYEVHKTYRARVEGRMGPHTAQRLARGVMLDDGPTAPSGVRMLESHEQWTQLELILHEGRKREVKRMCARVGHPVMHLRRIAVGPITTKGLEPGQWRRLTRGEVEALQQLTGLAPRKSTSRTPAPPASTPRKSTPRTPAPPTSTPRKSTPRKPRP